MVPSKPSPGMLASSLALSRHGRLSSHGRHTTGSRLDVKQGLDPGRMADNQAAMDWTRR